MYCEDMDLCRRLGEAGWQSVYVPAAVVTHTGGHATRRVPRAMLLEHHRSLYRYLARQYPGPAYLPVRLLLRLGLTLRAALALRLPALGEGAAPTRSADLLESA